MDRGTWSHQTDTIRHEKHVILEVEMKKNICLKELLSSICKQGTELKPACAHRRTEQDGEKNQWNLA